MAAGVIAKKSSKKAGAGAESEFGGSAVVTRLAAFVIATFGFTAYLLYEIEDPATAEVVPYLVIAIAMQFLPFLVRKKPDPFEAAGVASGVQLMALVPTLVSMLATGVDIRLMPHVSGGRKIELVQTVLIAYIAGTGSYFVGYYTRVGQRARNMFPTFGTGEWKKGRLILIVAVCSALFIPAYAYFQSKVQKDITDITMLGEGKMVWRGEKTMTWLPRAIALGFIPMLLLIATTFSSLRAKIEARLGKQAPSEGGKPVKGSWRSALLALGAFFVVAFLVTRIGQRSLAAYCMFNALIIVHYVYRRIPATVIVVVAFVLMVVANILGQYRSNPDAEVDLKARFAGGFSPTSEIAEHEADRERLGALCVVFDAFPRRHDYLLGASWSAVLIAPIPIWLWPDKMERAGLEWRDTAIVWTFTGAPVPTPFLGLLYANFSWIGVVLGMLLWGMFQRGLYEWLLANKDNKSVIALYSCMVVYVMPTTLHLSFSEQYVIPMWLALYLMKQIATKRRAIGGAAPSAASPGNEALLPAPSPAAE